jgi:hypothetical protein
MTRRFVSACLGAAFVGALAVSPPVVAKPPDLPLDETVTVAARMKPPVEEPIQPREGSPLSGGAIVPTPEAEPTAPPRIEPFLPEPILKPLPLYRLSDIKVQVSETTSGSLLFGVGVNSNSGMSGSIFLNERNFDCSKTLIPALYQLRPTARCTLAGSLLFGLHPLMTLLPVDKLLNAPCDHPQPVIEDDVLADYPENFETTDDDAVLQARGCVCTGFRSHYLNGADAWQWLLSHWANRHAVPPAEQNEGYVCVLASDSVAMDDEMTPNAAPELLPMPHEVCDADEDGITCPYLRQQRMDRHACQLADPEIGREVLDNLKRLQEAECLLEMARVLAHEGYSLLAMDCCLRAQERCAGSPCAERASTVLMEMMCGNIHPTTSAEEAAEDATEKSQETIKSDPSVELLVDGLMKSCHLLVSQGMHEQAAEMARQAFALDPQRVMADPLVYKMHLLAETPVQQQTGASEDTEQQCPYCSSGGMPIRGILKEKKKPASPSTTLRVPVPPPVDYEVVPALERVITESSVDIGAQEDGSLHVEGDYSLGGQVYHLRYRHGNMAFWKTTDASKVKP